MDHSDIRELTTISWVRPGAEKILPERLHAGR